MTSLQTKNWMNYETDSKSFCPRLFKQIISVSISYKNESVKSTWLLSIPGQTDKHCLTNVLKFCLSNMLVRLATIKHCLPSTVCFSSFKNIFLLVTSKNVCQAHICVMAKSTNIVLDKQNFNTCSSGRG